MDNNLEKKFNEWFDSLNKEEQESFIKSAKKAAKQIAQSNEELKKAIEPTAEVLAENLSTVSDRAKHFKTCFSDKKYEGLDLDIILDQYRGGLNITDICRASGISPSSMTKYVKGTTEIPAEKLIVLSDISGISIDMLLKQKRRKLDANFVTEDLSICEFNLETKEMEIAKEKFNILSKIPNKSSFLKFYRFAQPVQLFGMEVRPIYIVDTSWDNPALYEGVPFVGLISLDGQTTVKQISPIGRQYGIQTIKGIRYFTKTDLKDMLKGIILKTIIDY